MWTQHATSVPQRHPCNRNQNFWFINRYENEYILGTFLVLDIPKVPSDSTIWELCKSVFGIFGIKILSRLDSRDMCSVMALKWNKSVSGSKDKTIQSMRIENGKNFSHIRQVNSNDFCQFTLSWFASSLVKLY